MSPTDLELLTYGAHIASRRFGGVPEEWLGSCWEGLQQAHTNFDPNHPSKASFKTFAVGCMYRKCITHHRRFAGLKNRPDGWKHWLPDPHNFPTEHHDRHPIETHEEVLKQLSRLSSRDRFNLCQTFAGKRLDFGQNSTNKVRRRNALVYLKSLAQ